MNLYGTHVVEKVTFGRSIVLSARITNTDKTVREEFAAKLSAKVFKFKAKGALEVSELDELSKYNFTFSAAVKGGPASDPERHLIVTSIEEFKTLLQELKDGKFKIASTPVFVELRTLSGITPDARINDALRGEVLFERTGPVIAARFRCPSKYDLPIPVGDAAGAIVDFSVKDYDPQGCVQIGKNWNFKAPASGIYTVTAYLCCNQHGGASSAGGTAVTLHKNGNRAVEVYLAQLNPSVISGTMLGGTTDIALKKDETIDIRAHAFGNAGGAVVTSAGASWMCIRYVSPVSETPQ